MPRKLCTIWDGEPCWSNYVPKKKLDIEQVTLHGFALHRTLNGIVGI